MNDTVLDIQDLSVDFHVNGGWKTVTHGVALAVKRGETVALVGESGSGKSVTAMSVLDLLPPNARRRGRILFGGEDLVSASESHMRKLRGQGISMIFQEPMTALNPVYTIGAQLCEAIQSHRKISGREAKEMALDLLKQVNMPNLQEKHDHYPHQLSGGQRQRAMIAMAISSEPLLLIADEPTTALDVTVQAEILDLLRELQVRMHMAILIITHDMGIVAEVADRVVVMCEGKVVEEAPCEQLFAEPQEKYTISLLEAVPYLGREGVDARMPVDLADAEHELSPRRANVTSSEPPQPQEDNDGSLVLELRDTAIEYPGRFRRPGFRAVDGVSLSLRVGEILGLVGESGSGKTTIGRAAIGLIPAAAGRVAINGRDIASANVRQRRAIMRNVSIIFQDPASSLNPRASIGRSVTDPLRWTGVEKDSKVLDRKARELLDKVRIPADWADRHPHELSGGQRQRVGIARAIAVDPILMIADEPTSALDVSVQAAVLELLLDLQTTMGFSCLFISHDLAVVESLANRTVVLHQGKVVETGPTHEILRSPQHPYTQRLIAAAPVPDPVVQRQRRALRLATV